MSASRARAKGWRNSRPHIQLMKFVLASDEFGHLSGNAVKLLLELHRHYNGFNNGDLCATWTQLKARGWKSPGTLSRSIHELIESGFIVLSRITYLRSKPNLYALTYLAVDDCGGKLDIKETHTPTHSWKKKNKSLLPICTKKPVLDTHTDQETDKKGSRSPYEYQEEQLLH